MTRKLFVSLPMRGLSDDDIRKEMQLIKIGMEREYNEKFELINTLIEEDIPEDTNGCWYLGRSVQLLATADLCVFHPKWKEASGCVIEYMICGLYSIPYDVLAYENDDENN